MKCSFNDGGGVWFRPSDGLAELDQVEQPRLQARERVQAVRIIAGAVARLASVYAARTKGSMRSMLFNDMAGAVGGRLSNEKFGDQAHLRARIRELETTLAKANRDIAKLQRSRVRVI